MGWGENYAVRIFPHVFAYFRIIAYFRIFPHIFRVFLPLGLNFDRIFFWSTQQKYAVRIFPHISAYFRIIAYFRILWHFPAFSRTFSTFIGTKFKPHIFCEISLSVIIGNIHRPIFGIFGNIRCFFRMMHFMLKFFFRK